jgi:hypothetical protein
MNPNSRAFTSFSHKPANQPIGPTNISQEDCGQWLQANAFYCQKANAYVSREGCKRRLKLLKDNDRRTGAQRQQILDIGSACLNCKRFKKLD